MNKNFLGVVIVGILILFGIGIYSNSIPKNGDTIKVKEETLGAISERTHYDFAQDALDKDFHIQQLLLTKYIDEGRFVVLLKGDTVVIEDWDFDSRYDLDIAKVYSDYHNETLLVPKEDLR
ncbi:hypothetical protein [Salirhabdus salicampi]|uniref:hypothetical protein n=1 Tax=Salirhabdus salicampi TaxID=476102 RepID=UPI0020C3BA4F|nr:hypothetical protein [Salirhabdus salicampi]MCP8616370.1 hypothetical protein [Salirhabdus salicampi]